MATTAPASPRWSRSSPASSPERGPLAFDGRRRFASQADAKAAGIETVYQDLSLCTNLDVVANFFMGRELTRRVSAFPSCASARWRPRPRRALDAGGTRIPRARPRRHLSGGQRQAIELNRFVHWGGRLVILDEPFAALGVEQTRRGLETIDRVRQEAASPSSIWEHEGIKDAASRIEETYRRLLAAR